MNAFIFDMDGTILNSMDCWFNITNDILRLYGIEDSLDSSELERLTLQEGIILIIERFKIKETVEEVENKIFEFLYDKYRNHFTLKDGTIELFDYIKGKGGKIALATATDMKYVKGFLKKHKGIEDYFEFIDTVKITGPNKNQPEFFIKTIEKFKEKPKKTYMFEDAPHAMEAAKKAGMTVIGILEDTRENLRDLAIEVCDYNFKNIKEIDRSIFNF